MASSRASSLPHWFCVHRTKCGSELARECGLPSTITFRLAIKSPDAFAVRASRSKDRSLRQLLRVIGELPQAANF
jgi:hypothetical protein